MSSNLLQHDVIAACLPADRDFAAGVDLKRQTAMVILFDREKLLAARAPEMKWVFRP